MSNYTFTFKKDDICVEFTTTDRYIVERQFQLWAGSASDYANQMKSNSTSDEKKKLKPTEPVVQQKPAPQKEEPVAVEPAPAPVQQPVVQEEPKEAPQIKVVEEKQPEPIVEVIPEPEVQSPQVETVENVVAEEAEVFDKASSLLKTINSIQNPEPVQEPAPIDFEKVLETSIENPTFEPNKTKDENFLVALRTKCTTDKFHYLIITARYLTEVEKLERFSLKQINAKLMQNLSELVDHSILKSAIEQQFIELVPDLTGMSEVGEYRLTEKGEEFFANI